MGLGRKDEMNSSEGGKKRSFDGSTIDHVPVGLSRGKVGNDQPMPR